MEFWIDKKDCTGCGACMNICPRKAIKMVEDEMGFLYPQINKELCINCGMCKKTCPVFENKSAKRDLPTVYAGWSKDENVRYNSTSGGIFTEIAKLVLNDNGYIVGAQYGENNQVEHAITNTFEGLEKLRQSKYVQSNIGDIFLQVKELLEQGIFVAFAGSPCQIAGLYKFLRKKYSNLLTIEFICRGMNSPKAYKSWLSEIEFNKKSKISRVWFKYKMNGWKKSPRCTRLDFIDGSFLVIDDEKNLYMQGYLEDNLYIRPSCGRCKFNSLPRQADITLADFWGIEKSLDDDKGTSLILINSDIGEKYVNMIMNNINAYQRNIEEVYAGNVCFDNSVVINSKSEEFLKSLNEQNFSKQLKKYHKNKPLYKRLLNKLKKIVKKIFNN